MCRFVAIAMHTPNAPSHLYVASLSNNFRQLGWSVLLSSDLFFLAYKPDCLRPLQVLQVAPGIWIFGRLFRSDSANSGAKSFVECISEAERVRLIESNWRDLTTIFWGSYVFLQWHAERHQLEVMRGPMSRLPAFVFQKDSITTVFSNADDLRRVHSRSLTINWETIVAQLSQGDFSTDKTGLRGVRALIPGERWCFREFTHKCAVLWEPGTFQARQNIENFTQVAESLHATTMRCLSATVMEHRSVLVRLSGGLDSSIMMGCLGLTRLSTGAPLASAVTYFSEGGDDERKYARLAARHADALLYEFKRNESLDLACMNQINLTVQPVINASAPDSEARSIALAERIGATAIIDGELGDNLFGSSCSVGMLLECWRRHGMGRRFSKTLYEYAVLSRQSILRASFYAIKRGLTSSNQLGLYQMVLQHDAHDAFGRGRVLSKEYFEWYRRNREIYIHPWLRSAHLFDAGSEALLGGLITVTSPCSQAPFATDGSPMAISPLCSQPIVEFALQIPSYMHIAGSVNRAIARYAFSAQLPASIATRTAGKGGPHMWVRRVIARNEKFLKSLLLDGILAKAGMIERHSVEQALDPEAVSSQITAEQLWDLVYIEAWLRKWSSFGVK